MFLLKSNDVKKQNFKRRSRAVSTAGALKNKNTNLTPDREKTSRAASADHFTSVMERQRNETTSQARRREFGEDVEKTCGFK